MLLSDLFEKFVRDKMYVKNVTANTVKFYRASWAITEKYLKAKTIGQLSKDVLTDLIVSWRTEAKQQPKSINTYISFLNSFFTWLKEEGHTRIHYKMTKLKLEQTVFRVFTEAHIKIILRYQPKEYYDHRMWATLCLLLDTGVRSKNSIFRLKTAFRGRTLANCRFEHATRLRVVWRPACIEVYGGPSKPSVFDLFEKNHHEDRRRRQSYAALRYR